MRRHVRRFKLAWVQYRAIGISRRKALGMSWRWARRT